MVTVEKIQQSAIETNSNLSMGNENIKEVKKLKLRIFMDVK